MWQNSLEMPDQDVLSVLSPGDVILTSRLGFNIIKIGNFCKNGYHKRVWTHAALYLGDGDIVEAFPGGIVRRKLKDTYLSGEKVGLKMLRRKHLTPDAAQRIVNFCAQAKGEPYDNRALIFFPLANLLPPSLNFLLTPGYLGNWLNQEKSYFCSELVSQGFRSADAYCFEREPFQVMPADFANDLLFDEVATVHIPGKEKQGRVAAFLLQLAYILTAVAVFVIFLLIIALILGVAILTFRRLRPKHEEQPTNTTTEPAP